MQDPGYKILFTAYYVILIIQYAQTAKAQTEKPSIHPLKTSVSKHPTVNVQEILLHT